MDVSGNDLNALAMNIYELISQSIEHRIYNLELQYYLSE